MVLCVANCCVLRCYRSFPEICIVSYLVSGAEQSRNCQHFYLIQSFTGKSPAQAAAEMEGVAANFTCILQIKKNIEKLFK